MLTFVKIDEDNKKRYEGLILPVAYRHVGSPGVLSIGLDSENKPCGAAVVNCEEQDADMISLYIAPEFRRRGYAAALVNRVLSLLDEMNISGVSVSYAIGHDDLAAMDSLFEKNDFSIKKEERFLYSTTLGRLQAILAAQPPTPLPYHQRVCSARELPDPFFAELKRRFTEDGSPSRFDSEKGQIDLDVSVAYLQSDGVTAGLLAFVLDGGSLLADAVFSEGGEKARLLPLLKSACERALTHYSPSAVLYITPAFPPLAALLEEIAPGLQKTAVTVGRAEYYF